MQANETEPANPTDKDPTRSTDQISQRVYLDPSSPSVRSIARVVIVTLVMVFIANRIESILGAASFLFLLVIISILLAYLLDPLVRLVRTPFTNTKFERLMPRSVAILVSYLIVAILAGIIIANVVPVVVEQGKEFGSNIPSYVSGIRRTFNDVNKRFDRLRLPEDVQAKINEQAIAFGERITTGFGAFVLDVVTYLPWLIIVPVLTFFFLKDVNAFRLLVLRLFPVGRWRLRAESVLEDVNSTLAAYTRAQLISCLLIGTVCTIGFYLLGLKYALLFGILAGIFEFVPLIGPLVIGVIVVTVTAFADDPRKALYAGIFLIVLRVFHDYITYPRIVRGGVHLHPVVIILAILAGEQVAGIVGVFLAIPILAVFTVIYRHAVEHQGGRGFFAKLIEAEERSVEEAE